MKPERLAEIEHSWDSASVSDDWPRVCQEDIGEWQSTVGELLDGMRDLRAKNERLREALGAIAAARMTGTVDEENRWRRKRASDALLNATDSEES